MDHFVGEVTEEAIARMTTRQLKEVLENLGLGVGDCLEKVDLKKRVIVAMRTHTTYQTRVPRESPFPPATDPSRVNYRSDAAKAAAAKAATPNSSSKPNTPSSSANPSKRPSEPVKSTTPNSNTKKDKNSRDSPKTDNLQTVAGLSCIILENTSDPNPDLIGIGFHPFASNPKDLQSTSADIISSCQGRQKIRVYIPTGFVPVEGLPHAYAWWPLHFPSVCSSFLSPPKKITPVGFELASAKVLNFIDDISKSNYTQSGKRNPNTKFFLFGVNQGASLAIDVGLRMKERLFMIGTIGGGILAEDEWKSLMKKRREGLDRTPSGRVVATHKLRVLQCLGRGNGGEELAWSMKRMWEAERDWVDLEWVENDYGGSIVGCDNMRSAICKNLSKK